ncbi:hypothetical protein [Pseudarthrobacter sp. S9]
MTPPLARAAFPAHPRHPDAKDPQTTLRVYARLAKASAAALG